MTLGYRPNLSDIIETLTETDTLKSSMGRLHHAVEDNLSELVTKITTSNGARDGVGFFRDPTPYLENSRGQVALESNVEEEGGEIHIPSSAD